MTEKQASPVNDPSASGQYMRHLRWWICGLLFFATTINYVDRQVIGLLKPTLVDKLKWNQTDYGNITFWFQISYALGSLFAGRVIDRVGVRFGYGVAVFVWSLAAMSTAMARSVWGFAIARIWLGIGEGGNFPAAIRTVSEWFPKKERALSTGIFNAGSAVGALVTPMVVPWMAVRFGWQSAFIITGALGLIWLIAWFAIFRDPQDHPWLSKAEFDYIRSDPQDPTVPISWITLLKYRPTWAFAVGTLLTSPAWWFYLFWVPGFLNEKFHIGQLDLGLPIIIIYMAANLGSIAGGWLSSACIHRGWSINSARKTALFTCALCAVPVFAAPHVSRWNATLLISLAAAAHQGWSANLYTLISDAMPRYTVSSIVGIGTMAASLVAAGFSKWLGPFLDRTHSYSVPFTACACAYLLAIAAVQLIVPRLEPVVVSPEPDATA